jgi:rhamnulokinase
MPKIQPAKPGRLGGFVEPGVRLAHVGSHDTASALVGFGRQNRSSMYVNVGTWSLAMFILDEPIATPDSESANFTNERMVDGRVRFLKNIPGFYVVNRLHEELHVQTSISQWLASHEHSGESVDLFDSTLFNPPSMIDACAKLIGRQPSSESEWAGIALHSLADAIASQPREAEKLGVGRVEEIRLGGGGSQSPELCQAIADRAGMPVLAGPVEATVLGNLAVQFLAAGHIANARDLELIVAGSSEIREYRPA